MAFIPITTMLTRTERNIALFNDIFCQYLLFLFEVEKEKAVEQKTTVTEEDINALIQSEHYEKMGKKTTVCVLTLTNGFEIVGTSACVNPDTYKHEIGSKYARERAVAKVWELAGYELQVRIAYEKAF